jgi:hypothetical protein
MRSSEVRSLAIEAVASDRQKLQNVEREGLGRLPDNLDSVSSLLLFNSNENPYKAYRNLDNLTGAGAHFSFLRFVGSSFLLAHRFSLQGLKLRNERAKDDKGLVAAPGTVQEGLQLPNYGGEAVELRSVLFSLCFLFHFSKKLRSCSSCNPRVKRAEHASRLGQRCNRMNLQQAGCVCF